MCVTLRIFTQVFTVLSWKWMAKKCFWEPRASVRPAVLDGPLQKAKQTQQCGSLAGK